MSDPFIGQITVYPYNFPPNGWLDCAGQLLPIQQFAALFSLLGTTYGGNGTSNFGLPDLQGRIPVGQGHAGINQWPSSQPTTGLATSAPFALAEPTPPAKKVFAKTAFPV